MSSSPSRFLDPPSEMLSSSHKLAIILPICLLVVILLGFLGLWFYVHHRHHRPEQGLESRLPTAGPTSSVPPSSGGVELIVVSSPRMSLVVDLPPTRLARPIPTILVGSQYG